MKKIIYLHGLESDQGGDKVSFLTKYGFVYAPEMDYKSFTKKDFDNLLSYINDGDIIIGSSAGGYMADLLGSYKKCTLVLFNPALHSRTFNFLEPIEYGDILSKRIFVLGMLDDVVNAHITLNMIRKDDVVEKLNMKHRTPFFVFTNIYDKYIMGILND